MRGNTGTWYHVCWSCCVQLLISLSAFLFLSVALCVLGGSEAGGGVPGENQGVLHTRSLQERSSAGS